MGVLQPGDEIDIWVVDRALGQGGMGSVYRCHNREAKRILAAVKVLDASFVRQPSAKARFVREAEILFSLDHPGIVKVRNVRMDLAMPYLEMEFIDGVNLEVRAHEGTLSGAEALSLFVQVADALAYLHARGIRHRDVKPSNLVVQPNGVVKLVDFGIATEADGATITERGQTFGSVSYAPPEWLDPDRLDPVRWDIYSAGVVFHELLTGTQAFPMTGSGSMQQQVLRMMSAKQLHAPLDPGPRYPASLRALVRDMTHPLPEARLADADAVRARLAAVDLTDIEVGAAAAAVRRDTSAPTWVSDAAEAEHAPAGLTMVPGDDAPPPPAAPGRPAPAPPFGAPPTQPRVAPRIVATGAGLAALLLAGAWAWESSSPDARVAAVPEPAPVAAPVPAAPAPTEPPPVAPPEPTPAVAAEPPTTASTATAALAPVERPANTTKGATGRRTGPGAVVTSSAFARWLAAHPEWTPEGAREAGKADAGYLAGWSGADAPAGKGGEAVVDVTWAAASAYCAGRGGLLGVDAPPLTWTEPTQPWHEYRVADGRPVWRRSDGATSVAVDRDRSYPAIGFRCAH